MFSISNFSEFGPRGGGQNFSIISEIQNILNYPRGAGGSSLIGNFSQIFPFFFSDGSPKCVFSGSEQCTNYVKEN